MAVMSDSGLSDSCVRSTMVHNNIAIPTTIKSGKIKRP